MKIAVIGASSGTGEQVVRQALEQGYLVKAFSRNPGRLNIQDPNLELIAGDARKLEEIEKAVQGTDAVICTLGAPASDKSGLRAAGTRNIIQAMEKQGVARLVCLSSLGFGDSRPLLPAIMKWIIVPFFLKHAFADHAQQEGLVEKSALNWTIVRPGNLSNAPARGNYHHGFSFTERSIALKSTPRADVAAFMLKQVVDQRYSGKKVGISS